MVSELTSFCIKSVDLLSLNQHSMLMKSTILKSFFVLTVILIVSSSVFCNEEDLLIEKINTTNSDSLKINLLIDLVDRLTYSNPERAINFLTDALSIIETSSTSYKLELAKCYNRLGIISSMQGRFVEAIDYYQKALDIFELLQINKPENQDFFEGMVNIYGNIGTIYYHQQNYKRAVEYWKKSLLMLDSPEFDFSRAQLLNNIGVASFESGQNDTAVYYYKKALETFQITDSEQDVAMCYTNLGEVYNKEGLYTKAIVYLQNSLEIKEKLEDNHGLSNCLVSLSRLNYNMDNSIKSIEYAIRAIDICNQTENLNDLLDAYELLAGNYENMQDFKLAYIYHKKFKEINDSIFNKESNEKFIEVQSKYESEKKENELQLFRQKEKNQILIRKTLIYGILVLLIISVFVIWTIIVKRKNEKQLYEANAKLKEKEAMLMRQELDKKELIARELSIEIDYKSKQLTTHALNMMQKNKMLHSLVKDVDDISKQAKPEVKVELRKLKSIVKKNIRNEKEWDTFRLYFEQVNKGFYDSLIAINASLNAHDLRHCALVKLNLNIKEAASVLNLSPNTVKSARYRIKKKLNLKPEDDLYEFIRDI